jgi:eukaryotic-like serine/threonine-protein kinase
MSDEQALSTPPAPDLDLTGRRMGDYRLLRRLGRGGMADVYLAEQESLHRRVAFKVLKSSLARDASYVRRFVHEAQAAASLVHASIVQIHEVGCLDGLHFMVQEYVEGQNLRQHLQRHGSLDAATTVHILRQVAAALQKAGQQKLTHRDIKPENIMLSTGGEVKVADFGLARIDRQGQAVDLTQVGMTLGTPLYMSPEQIEGRPVDTRSDIYSLGVTCYQMLAGRPPFEGDTPLSIAVQHLHKEPARLEDARPDLPSGLCRIVHKMLAKSPQDRYQTAGELLTELRSLQLAGVPGSWPSGDDQWNAPETVALTAARVEATQQLDAVLRREAAIRRGPRLGWRWAVAVVVAAALGAGWAWFRRPAPLLQVSEADLPEVQRQTRVEDQYLYASRLATESAWQSLSKYFPPEASEQNRYYGLLAKQRLAELYQQRGDLTRALEMYTQVAETDAPQPRLRASGLVGQANVHLLRGEETQAKQLMVPLQRLVRDLPADQQRLIHAELNFRLRPELEPVMRDFAPSKKRLGSGPKPNGTPGAPPP